MAFTSTLLPLAPPAAHYSPSSSDSSVSGRSSVSTRPSLRTVTLSRRRPQACLGFSLRGGREHGTGFFISGVESGSEAYHQGLAVGDQIIRINGLPVEDATHREVLQLIQSQHNMTFKVRSVGMIPVKESYSESLSWRLVEPEPGGGGMLEPPDLGLSSVRLFINVAPKAKLGCGICKGPDWKPGIFVQFTKENSLARGAGLRPGDQILQCNSVPFSPDIPFTEAVSVLRSTGLLELVIQKGAGVDLFPGESSGYNSSASSVAGDQSPETWPNKRLSIVKEESVIDSDRLTSSELSRGGERNKDSDRAVQSNHYPVKPQTTDGACTVIRVCPDLDPLHETNEHNSSTKLAEICMVSQQLETKTTTVLVEVHQSEDEDNANNQSDTSLCQLTNSSSVSSFSSSGANSLCSAISQELQRRSEKRAKEGINEIQSSKMELHKCGMDKEKVEQHQQLMEEFRRAHKKMFAHTINEENKTDNNYRHCPLTAQSKEERESFRIKRHQKEEQHVANMNQERILLAMKERDLRLERDKQDMTEAERELTRLLRRQQNGIPPPPPPPLPSNGDTKNSQPLILNDPSSIECNLPPLPARPPDTPTPDYDKESLASESSEKNNIKISMNNNLTTSIKNGNADFVEMQSLESFKLTNPTVVKPKPPPVYFQPNTTGSSSSTTSRISSGTLKPNITIREYPTITERKNPERFQFLDQNGASQNMNNVNHNSCEPLTARLQDELCETLSKANLQCDSPVKENGAPGRSAGKNVVKISINAQPSSQQREVYSNKQQPKQPPFYLHKNGNAQINNNNISHSKEPQRKISTTVINPSHHTNGIKSENITTFNSTKFSSSKNNEKVESRITVVQPNGILKNGLGGNISQVQIHPSQVNKSPPKCIKFAGISSREVK